MYMHDIERQRESENQTNKQTSRQADKPNRKTNIHVCCGGTRFIFTFSPYTVHFDLCMTSIPTNRIYCFAPIYACNYLICSVHWLNDKQKAQRLEFIM